MKSKNSKQITKKKQIVFFEPFPTVMLYKIAKLFKKKGYETILIVLLGSDASKKFHKSAFDKIIFFDLSFFRLNLKNAILILSSLFKKISTLFQTSISILKLKPYAVFTRAAPSWPCAIMRILFKKTPLIYFPYDIRSQYYLTPKQAKEIGNMPKFEIKAERYCFETADGVMHKGDPNELKFVSGRMLGEKVKLPPLQLSFFPYSSKEFMAPLNKNKLSKKDGKIHIVYLGSMGSVGPGEATYLFNCIRTIIKQGINVHVYARPNSISTKELLNFFKEENEFTKIYNDVIKSKYFHLHKPLEPNEITFEISKYDFGLWPGHKSSKDYLEIYLALGNKLSSYIEGGIPFISDDLHTFILKIGNKYGISIPYNKENLRNIKEKLEKENYKQLEKNIKKARKDFDMDKNFPRLERFVKEVVTNKKR